MNEAVAAAQVWHRFSRLPGSQHIARKYAVFGLIHWLRKLRPRLVVEVGAGIGTLTYASLVALRDVHVAQGERAFRLITVENDPFCLEQLQKNLGDLSRGVEIAHEFPKLSEGQGLIEFLIVDGGDPKATHYYTNLAKGAVVFVESHRGSQRNSLTDANAQRRYASACFRALDGDGRYWLYKFEPTVKERVTFALVKVHTGVRILIYKSLRRLLTREQMSTFCGVFSKLYTYERTEGAGGRV